MATGCPPGVVAEMARLLDEGRAGEAGTGPRGPVRWRLAATGRQLDANVVRLAPQAAIGAHAELDLDVLTPLQALNRLYELRAKLGNR